MPQKPLQPFGLFVRNTRIEKNLSQQDVERNGGPSQSTISSFEKTAESDNPKVPSRRMVVLFARGLQVDLEVAEKAAGFMPGATRSGVPAVSPDILAKAGMSPAWLATGDLIYLATTDPYPEETLAALEIWLTGWRQGMQARNSVGGRKRVINTGASMDAPTPTEQDA